MIFCNFASYYFYPFIPTDSSYQITSPDCNISKKHRISIFCYPNYMVIAIIYGMTTSFVITHLSIIYVETMRWKRRANTQNETVYLYQSQPLYL